MRSGIVLVDKPSGPTSHDIVEMFRRLLAIRRVGHMGTLDPLATGLLLVGVGEGTKLTPFLSDLDKTYECVARLGARSTTYDAMGEIENVADPARLDVEAIERALVRFRGTIEQVPPPFSAVKVGGLPLYKYARRGMTAELKPRRVRVHQIELLTWEPPDLQLRLHVSSGTYVRSLVHDLGDHLGVGGYVAQLRRTAVGPFSVAEAVAVGSDGTVADDWPKAWRSMSQALVHWTKLQVPDSLVDPVGNGALIAAGRLGRTTRLRAGELYALVDADDNLLAVARCLVSKGNVKVYGATPERGQLILKPVRVFRNE